MKASELFVKSLENEGVEYIFGIPGEENLDMLDALSRSSIKLILTRHEQAAGFMAATYGRLTGKAGVCLSTLGPGATNLVTAAAYAQLGGMPMVMITGQKPIKTSKQGQFQIIDVVDMMRPLTKHTRQITSGANIPSRVREAFRLAEEERPGATHLELPEDIARERTNEPVVAASLARRPIAEEKAIRVAVERIEKSRHPLLLVGAAANRKMTCRVLRQFIEHTGIPFVTTQMGKGVVDERHPLFLGNAALSADDYVHRAIESADLIINVGHDVIEKPPFFMRRGGVEVIHVNFFTAAVDPVYFPQVEVVGDIANSVWQTKEQLTRQSHWVFSR
jgi:acetolactate synthase-1/2/3 large subunit